jgi:hypothetical protein
MNMLQDQFLQVMKTGFTRGAVRWKQTKVHRNSNHDARLNLISGRLSETDIQGPPMDLPQIRLRHVVSNFCFDQKSNPDFGPQPVNSGSVLKLAPEMMLKSRVSGGGYS